MNTYIALLRGVNVGGHKKFPKVDQLQMMEALGFEQSQAYIHTGNWIFQSGLEANKIASLIRIKIAEEYGWEVPIMVITLREFKIVFSNCPFSEDKKEASYFVILEQEPLKEKIALLDDIRFPNEEFELNKKCVYFYPALGAGKAKLSNNYFEEKLKVNATTRNFRTMAKIIEMATS